MIVREPPPDFVVAPAWILIMTVAIAAVAVMLVRLPEKFVNLALVNAESAVKPYAAMPASTPVPVPTTVVAAAMSVLVARFAEAAAANVLRVKPNVTAFVWMSILTLAIVEVVGISVVLRVSYAINPLVRVRQAVLIFVTTLV